MKQPEINILKSGPPGESIAADKPEQPGILTDQELLSEYAATESEHAFAQIVMRHAAFVYSAALRQAGNQTAAEEITQAVFVILSRKASSLRRETMLEGWLFRAVRYAAWDARKIEARRFRREREAARMHSTVTPEGEESAWAEMAPLVDEALASLSAKDRSAILLRFFEKKGFRDIAETLGGNQNSARLRVVRALDKLRRFFQRRGIVVSSGLLSSALLVHSSQAASPVLVSSVMGMVASGQCPAAVGLLVSAILRRIWWRSWWLWAGSLALAIFLAVAVAGFIREDRVPVATQTRTVAMAVDNAISFDNPDLLIGQIHFRNLEEEQFKPVLSAFIRAAAGLRKQVRETFGAQPVRAQIWLWTVDQLFQGQPRRGQNDVSSDRVTDDFFQVYLMVMVKVEHAWKWDFFASLPPDVARQRMKILRDKTVLCERVTQQIRDGEITTPELALARIQNL